MTLTPTERIAAIQKKREYQKAYQIEYQQRAGGPEYRKTAALKYYYCHTEERNEWGRTKAKCECGGKYTFSNKSRHDKCNKHIRHLEA